MAMMPPSQIPSPTSVPYDRNHPSHRSPRGRSCRHRRRCSVGHPTMKVQPATRLQHKGQTRSGHTVVGGVYAFFETHGLPLSDTLAALWRDHQMLPDWLDLVRSMSTAGRPLARAIEAVSAAVRDACCYPDAMAAMIVSLLEHPLTKQRLESQ